MRKRFRFLAAALCLAATVTTLSGCIRSSADDLYSLPQASQEYLKLQEQINAVLSTGAEYSPPTSGSNRQSVQFKDLDGDGVNEAIAFFKTSGDKPLKIYIMKQNGNDYKTINILDGDGTAIESIRYADMDGDNVSELVVGWQMNPSLLHMSIYSIKGDQSVLLAGADYSKLVLSDVDEDGLMDVVALKLSSSDIPGEATMYSMRSDGELIQRAARLSNGIETIKRILKGNLSDGSAAIYVEGTCSGGTVTDIFSWQYGAFTNVSLKATSSISEDTLRTQAVYSTDINHDGIIEVPSTRLLDTASDNSYYVIDWYTYNLYGVKAPVFTTYHDFADGWYLILPDDWKDQVTIRRDDSVSGERTLIFSHLSGTDRTPSDFLKIYTLSGDNKEDRSKLTGRFKLLEHGDTIYAAQILTTGLDITLSKGMVIENFRLIYSDWVTGVY